MRFRLAYVCLLVVESILVPVIEVQLKNMLTLKLLDEMDLHTLVRRTRPAIVVQPAQNTLT